MNLTIFGTNACKDCLAAIEELNARNIDYTYLEFSEDINNLKEFLKLRDTEALFDEVKKEGKVGVPCFQLPDGTLTLSLEEEIGSVI